MILAPYLKKYSKADIWAFMLFFKPLCLKEEPKHMFDKDLCIMTLNLTLTLIAGAEK